MEQRSPTIEGFRLMFRQPAFGLAEVTWRWSVGFAAWLLLAFSFFAFLDTLPVTHGDLFLLRTRQPALIAKALARILQGSGGRVVSTFVVLGVCLAIAWIVVSALGRAATVEALFGHFRSAPSPHPASEVSNYRTGSLLGLNFFRVVAFLATGVGCLAPLAVAHMAHSEDPALAFVLFMAITVLVFAAWSALNWFLSVAALFVVGDGENTFGAMSATIDLCRTRPGPVFAVGAWFGLARISAFAIATFLALTSIGMLGVLPFGLVLFGVVFVTLLYFGVVDFLYIGRLAAYAAVLEMPESPVRMSEPLPIVSPQIQNLPAVAPVESVDPDELILSDHPPLI